MDLGAYFLPVDFPEYMRSVQVADEVGYATAWIPDSQMIWQDVYVYMTRGLAGTARIRFGSAVTNAVTRHFTVTASAHATLADLHPGRVILGLGRGDSSVRTLGLRPLRIREMREVLGQIRALTQGQTLDTDRGSIRITWANEPMPLMVGCSGPRTMALAGALADVVTLELGASPAALTWAIENIRGGADEAGRDPGEIRIVALCGMWISDDIDEARANCRWAPASAANHIAEVLHNNPDCGMPEDLLRIDAARRAGEARAGSAPVDLPSVEGTYDYYGGHCINQADHAAWVTDDVVDEFTLAGKPALVVDRLAELARIGVDEVAAAFLNGADDQMRRVGVEVIPRLADLGARSSR